MLRILRKGKKGKKKRMDKINAYAVKIYGNAKG